MARSNGKDHKTQLEGQQLFAVNWHPLGNYFNGNSNAWQEVKAMARNKGNGKK